MSLGFLLDENLPAWWRETIHRQNPSLEVWQIGDPATPSRGAQDPEILEWCEAKNFLLLTNNRKSLPNHLSQHLAGNRHVPGILIVDPEMDIHHLLDNLILIEGASFPDEYRDQIRYLPL